MPKTLRVAVVRLRRVAALGVLVSVICHAAAADPVSSVASFWDLGMGARPLAMGEAFVGLADDESALFSNPAGLAWGDGRSIHSSAEVRPSIAGYGHVTACVQNISLGLHYFDFGDINQVNESGSVVGTFFYHNYGILAGTGFSAARLPLLSSIDFTECIGFGANAKLLIVDTLDQGDGGGFAADISFLLRVDDPWFGQPHLNRLSLGVIVQNILGNQLVYESGHREDWPKKVAIGVSVTAFGKLIASLEVRSTETLHMGFEWKPVPLLALRWGLKRDGIWIWSIGLGIRSEYYSFDYALAVHPYLSDQHRASFGMRW